jgi:thiol-disulfide isomerase/thioredoxin
MINTKRIIRIGIALTFTYSISFGQNLKIKPLAIGDTLPEIVLKTFLKDSSKHEKLSDYYKNKKLLLIDFSATWCVPCVKVWPEMDSIKKIFNGTLEILAVTQEKKADVQRFFLQHPNLGKLNIDFITDNLTDKPVILPYLFPGKMVPQVVWVNAKGQVIALTDGGKVNEKNIAQAIKDQSINLPVKKDALEFDIRSYELMDTISLYKSIIAHTDPGINSGVSYRPAQNADNERKLLNSIVLTRLDVFTLFREGAFHHSISDLNTERLIWDLPDSIRANYEYNFYKRKTGDNDIDAWYDKNAFSMEIKTDQLNPEQTLYSQIINNLNTCFNLNGHFEKRQMPCWILKSSNPNTIKTKGENPKILYKQTAADILTNQPMSKFLYFINKALISGWIVDETAIDFNIDIDLTGFRGFMTTPETMNQVLGKYNLHLEKTERMVDVFVISQKKN